MSNPKLEATKYFDFAKNSSGDSENMDLLWANFVEIITEFLDSNENLLAVINLNTLSNEVKVSRMIRAFDNTILTRVDLFQFSFRTTNGRLIKPVYYYHGFFGDLGKLVGRFFARYSFIYKAWISVSLNLHYFLRLIFLFFATKVKIWPLNNIFLRAASKGPFIFAQNERRLRNLLGVRIPILYHSFESGSDGFVLSRKFARHLTSINNPPLLGVSELMSSCARTQNLISMRLLRPLYK